MGLSRGVKSVQRPTGYSNRRIKAKGSLRKRDVIIDRFGNADNINAQFPQFQCHCVRPIPANKNQRLNSIVLQVLQYAVRHVAKHILPIFLHFIVKRIIPVGGSQDSSTARQNPSHVFIMKRDDQSYYWINSDYLNWTKDFGQHNIMAMAGFEAIGSTWEGSQLIKSNLSSNDIQVIGVDGE